MAPVRGMPSMGTYTVVTGISAARTGEGGPWNWLGLCTELALPDPALGVPHPGLVGKELF